MRIITYGFPGTIWMLMTQLLTSTTASLSAPDLTDVDISLEGGVM